MQASPWTAPDKIYCTRGGFIPNFDFEPSKYNLNMNQMVGGSLSNPQPEP